MLLWQNVTPTNHVFSWQNYVEVAIQYAKQTTHYAAFTTQFWTHSVLLCLHKAEAIVKVVCCCNHQEYKTILWVTSAKLLWTMLMGMLSWQIMRQESNCFIICIYCFKLANLYAVFTIALLNDLVCQNNYYNDKKNTHWHIKQTLC